MVQTTRSARSPDFRDGRPGAAQEREARHPRTAGSGQAGIQVSTTFLTNCTPLNYTVIKLKADYICYYASPYCNGGGILFSSSLTNFLLW